MNCTVCNKKSYSQLCYMHKPRKSIARLKRPRQQGKEYERWKKFRDEVAKPYLDETFGHFCVDCKATGSLDIDHIKTRGSRPDLKYDLKNLTYKCRLCHIKKTNRE